MTHKFINILFNAIPSFVPHSEFPTRRAVHILPQFVLRIIFCAHVSDILHMTYYFSFTAICISITHNLCIDSINHALSTMCIPEKLRRRIRNIRKIPPNPCVWQFGFWGPCPSVQEKFSTLPPNKGGGVFVHYSYSWYDALGSPVNLQHHGHLKHVPQHAKHIPKVGFFKTGLNPTQNCVGV